MGIFGNLKSNIAKARKEFADQADNFKNLEFKNAAMGICALVAAADGTISGEEQQTVIDAIDMLPEFATFNKPELVGIFSDFCDKIQRNKTFGTMAVMAEVKKLSAKHPEQSEKAIAIGVAIANADNDFDRSEQEAVRNVCKELAVNPSKFGL